MSSFSLKSTCAAFGKPEFARTFEAEMRALPRYLLPLDDIVTPGAWVDPASIGIRFLGATPATPAALEKHDASEASSIRVRFGVFYSETIGNCGCGDDPYTQDGYAELALNINRATARAVCDPDFRG